MAGDHPGQPVLAQRGAVRRQAVGETVRDQQQPIALPQAQAHPFVSGTGDQAHRQPPGAHPPHRARGPQQQRMRVARLHEGHRPAGGVGIGVDAGQILIHLHILDHHAVESRRHLLRRAAGGPGTGPEGRVAVGCRAREHSRQPRRHHPRGNPVARHIDRVEGDPPGPQRKAAHQIAAHLPRRAQQQRDRRPAEIHLPVACQRLLQPPCLPQVAVERAVNPAQFGQRVAKLAVAGRKFALHRDKPRPGLQPGPQLIRVHGFGEEIIGPHVQPARDLALAAVRGEQDEKAVSFLRQAAEGPAEVKPGHAGHHPVAEHDIERRRPAQVERLGPRCGLRHLVTPAAQPDRQHPPLRPAVVHDKHATRRRRGPHGGWHCNETHGHPRNPKRCAVSGRFPNRK